MPQTDLFNRQPPAIEYQGRIGRTTRLPDQVEHGRPLQDAVLEVDGQVEQDMPNADLIEIAERVRVRRSTRSASLIFGPRRPCLGRVGHVETKNREPQ